MSQVDWGSLKRLQSGVPIERLGSELSLLDDDICKLSESQYCVVDALPDGSDSAPRISSLFWACNEKAFRRAYFKEIEGDDLVVCEPPHELLPSESGATYGEILAALRSASARGLSEYASYRVMTDGAFVHRGIETDFVAYYFRSQCFDADEKPYAILWKMRNA